MDGGITKSPLRRNDILSKMKKILIVVFFVSIIFVAFQYIKQRNDTEILAPSSNFDSIELSPTITKFPIQTDGKSMNSSWVIVRDMSKIELRSNLDERLGSVEAKEKYGCGSLINGGFYTKENTHIGLFVTNGQKLTSETTNSLFNGFLSITKTDAVIGASSPALDNIALQTGPLLMKNGTPLPLSLARDENARRMVAATTPQDDIVFLTLYDSSSLASGPKLEDVPAILLDIDKKTSLDFKDAINLDGGAHSAFISEEIQLTDFQTIGSYFCVKN